MRTMSSISVYTANPNLEEDTKNNVFKATILAILLYGVSNFNLSDCNIRTIEAKWDHLN